MDVVIDDRLLRAVLARAEPTQLRRIRRRGEVYTTGHFYLRLCRAAASPATTGVLSGPIGALSDEERVSFVRELIELPDTVGMVSLGDLGWRMGELVRSYRLNVLGLEVLAAAERLGATVCMAAGNEGPLLREAVLGLGFPYRVVST